MVPCCRRHHPWRRKTFLDNSEFLRFRPAPTPTSLHNLKAAHLATISKDIHIDSQLQVGKTRKTAVLGRIRSSVVFSLIKRLGEIDNLRIVQVHSHSTKKKFQRFLIARVCLMRDVADLTANAVLIHEE